MFTDYYLRAETEAALKDALPFAVSQSELTDPTDGRVLIASGGWVVSSPGLYELDIIGPLIVTDGVYGEPDPETGEREQITPPEVDERFHANLRLIGAYAPTIPDDVTTSPATPRRVFA